MKEIPYTLHSHLIFTAEIALPSSPHLTSLSVDSYETKVLTLRSLMHLPRSAPEYAKFVLIIFASYRGAVDVETIEGLTVAKRRALQQTQTLSIALT